ncbi:hypothetical protein JCM15764A_29740 [Geotalea toluenoxydans]
MNLWSDLKVKTKILALVLMALLILLLVGGMGLGNMKSLAGNEGDMALAVKHVDMLGDMKNDFLAVRLNLVYMLALNDKAKIAEKADDIAKRSQKIKSEISAFAKSGIEPEEQKLIDSFKEGFEAYLVQGNKLAEMARNGADDPTQKSAATAYATAAVAPLYEKPATALDALADMNVKGAAATHDKDMAAYDRSFILLVAIIAIAVLGLLGIGLFIASSISKPLQEVFDTLAGVAAGDLTVRTHINSRDEMGLLAGEVNEMAVKLMDAMNQVAQTSVQVASAAEQLHCTSEQMATGAEEVAAQAATVATASEEMAATSMEIAQSCHHAADGGQQADERALTGVDVVKETVAVMGRIAERVKTSAVLSRFKERPDWRDSRHHRGYSRSDQPAGAQCRHRGGQGWGAGAWFCRGGRRGQGACRAHHPCHQGNRRDDQGYSTGNQGCRRRHGRGGKRGGSRDPRRGQIR